MSTEKKCTKSILDGIPVVDNTHRSQCTHHVGEELLEIVSRCPSCGNPIYGKLHASDKELDAINVHRTCSCQLATIQYK